MKIRIKGNSIRFRLARPEVDYFRKEKYIEESVDFGNRKLLYALSSLSALKEISAQYENDRIILNIPSGLVDEWTGTEMVGIESEMKLNDGKKLYILVEKDFKCLDNTSEDQSENYPNPLAQKQE